MPRDPEAPEVSDYYLELACEQLNVEEEVPCWTIEDQEVIDRAYELEEAARAQFLADKALDSEPDDGR